MPHSTFLERSTCGGRKCYQMLLISGFIYILMCRWHDTDNNTIPRFLGVPVSSSMWLMVFTCVFSFLINYTLPSSPTSHILSLASFRCLVLVCVGSVPLMMVHMMIVQIAVGQALPPTLPPPNFLMFILTAALYLLLSVAGFVYFLRSKVRQIASHQNIFLSAVVFGYHTCLFLIASLCDPAQERSISVHQTYGPSEVIASDWSGLSRQVYLSKENMRHTDYFEIIGDIDMFTSWYEIRGLPKSNEWTQGFFTILAVSCVFYLVFPYFMNWLTRSSIPSGPQIIKKCS